MGQIDDDFAITVRPTGEGAWSGALVDMQGGVWPIGVFSDADQAVRSAMIARGRVVSQPPARRIG